MRTHRAKRCSFKASSGALPNTGLLEATSGGILQVNGVTVNNAGGNITANSGSTVQLFGGTDIQGGTLNNNRRDAGNLAGNTAILDGSTNGPLTINGTYTADTGSTDHFAWDDHQQWQHPVERGQWHQCAPGVRRRQYDAQGGGTVTLSTASGGGTAFI